MKDKEIYQERYNIFLSARTIIILLMDAIYKKFFEEGVTNSVVLNINVIAVVNKVILFNKGIFQTDSNHRPLGDMSEYRFITKLSVRDVYNEIEASDDLMWYENNPSSDYIAVQPESPEEEFDKDIMSKAVSKELQFFMQKYRISIMSIIDGCIKCLEYKDKNIKVLDGNGDPIPGVTRFVYAPDNLGIGYSNNLL